MRRRRGGRARAAAPLAIIRQVRGAVAVVVAVLVAANAAAAAIGPTSLRIRVWPDGPAGASTAWTLRCAPAGGTLPRSAHACRVLASLASPFAPVPPGVACTQIYGGPDEALVAGTFRGRRVFARFNRRNGCEIARWERVRALFVVSRSHG